jgi:ribosome recycling factor
MIDQKMSEIGVEFEKILAHLHEEFSRLQVGRANASLVENVSVDMYGVPQPLKAVASISIPDSRSIVIQPWDKNALGPIEKGIADAGLGLNPINDGILVRIAIPALTEERRKELTKHVKQLAEHARISVRNVRQDVNNKFKQLKSSGDITEDDLRGAEKKLQEKVDEVNKKIDDFSVAKENDVMTI